MGTQFEYQPSIWTEIDCKLLAALALRILQIDRGDYFIHRRTTARELLKVAGSCRLASPKTSKLHLIALEL